MCCYRGGLAMSNEDARKTFIGKLHVDGRNKDDHEGSRRLISPLWKQHDNFDAKATSEWKLPIGQGQTHTHTRYHVNIR